MDRVCRFLAGMLIAVVPGVAVTLSVWSPLVRRSPHLRAPGAGDYASALVVTVASLAVAFVGFTWAVRALRGVPDEPPRRGP